MLTKYYPAIAKMKGNVYANKIYHSLRQTAQNFNIQFIVPMCQPQLQLGQLECLRSEDTPRHPMIIHTIDSYWIPSHNKTKSKLQIQRISHKFKFLNVIKTLLATHFLKVLDNTYKYKMDLASIVEDTEQMPSCPQTDRRTGVKPVYQPLNSVEAEV